MKFQITFKLGTWVKAVVVGRERDAEPSDQDGRDVLELERRLEHLLGLRAHITTVGTECRCPDSPCPVHQVV